MYCICANGDTLSKQDDQRYAFNEDESSSSCTNNDEDGYWNTAGVRSREHGSRKSSNTSMDRSSLERILPRNARCRTAVVIDVSPFDDDDDHSNNRQHEPPTTSSYSSSSSSAASMPANGGHFSRRRQSLVEALSNPVSSTRSNSPVSSAPIGALPAPLTRSTTSINVSSSRPSSSVVSGNNEHQDAEHRLFAIDELIRCERDYVSLLSALYEGFAKPACRHSELFDAHLVRAIFGNLHQLRNLHEKLLFDLEAAIVKTPLCLGPCFLQHICTRTTFEVYSHYCNNHQRSCRRLSQLYKHEAYMSFFEDCRRVCRLPTLRLDAFLLRPVQQLCRYPLLLATLLQRTPKTHHDYKAVSAALQATQQLLTVVNNRRRLFEQLQELARWQKTVTDWKGPDLLYTSSRLVYSGELVCSCYMVGENIPRWRKRVCVFLFDRLLVLCRKDRLKKQLVFKGRMDLDGTNKACLLNGGAWQLSAPTEGKRLLFKASSKHEAKLWLEALNKERYLVQQTARLPTSEEKMLAIEMAKDQD